MVLVFCVVAKGFSHILQALTHNPALILMYTHIVIDEVHHRTTNGDLVLLILQSLIAKTRDTKIIMMSATLQDSLLTSYFHAYCD